MAGVEAEHVHQADVAVNVVRVLEEIGWVEGSGDVPPETVALGEKKLYERWRIVDAVVFYIEDGVGTRQDTLSALEDAKFVAFNVDFDEGDRRVVSKGVEWIARGNLRRRRRAAHHRCAEVPGTAVVGRIEGDGSRLSGTGIGPRDHVHEPVEGQVGAKLLEDDRLGFEGEHGAVLGRQGAGQRNGVDAHVGAHLDDHAGEALWMREELKEGLDFVLAAFAITKEGLAHVDVIGVDEHDAVAGLGELVRRRNLMDCWRTGHHLGYGHGPDRSVRGSIGAM